MHPETSAVLDVYEPARRCAAYLAMALAHCTDLAGLLADAAAAGPRARCAEISVRMHGDGTFRDHVIWHRTDGDWQMHGLSVGDVPQLRMVASLIEVRVDETLEAHMERLPWEQVIAVTVQLRLDAPLGSSLTDRGGRVSIQTAVNGIGAMEVVEGILAADIPALVDPAAAGA